MTLEEMHEKRSSTCARVREHGGEALAQNGLELESVALVDLDQTSLEFFDPSNAFDAEGLTQLTETIELGASMRNEIEQQTLVDIRNQNLEVQRRVLEIDRESEYARIDQEREVEIRRAEQRAELARERALRDQEAEQAHLGAPRRSKSRALLRNAAISRGAHRQRGGDPAPRNRPPPCARPGRDQDARADGARADRA